SDSQRMIRRRLAFSLNQSRIIAWALLIALLGAQQCPARSNLVERPPRELLLKVDIATLSPDTALSSVLRQKSRETLMESYFDAASIQAEAHREQAVLQAQRESLKSKRD